MALAPYNPELLAQFQATNPQFMEQYRQAQQEQQEEQPSQQAAPPASPKPTAVPRRPFRPSIRGNLFHSRPFAHLGHKKK